MVSRFHDKFNEDLELIYAKYTNPFDGAPELTLSTCDLPENVHILENYKYSNCGKWKVLEADSTDAYEVYHSPAKEKNDTSDEDNNDTSDDEYQSSCYDSDDQNHSDCSGKYPRSCAKTLDTASKNSRNVSKTMPSNHKICNLPPKQLYCEDEETNSEMELSKQYSSDEYFKPERTVTISKDLWTQVQQCLHLMTSVFSQLNSEHGDENELEKHYNERPPQRQPSLIRRSSVKQRLFNDDNTSQTSVPQGLVVEKLFVRHKALSGSGVELASRQSFLHDTKSKISEIESLDSGFCQENSGDVDASTQDYSQPENNLPSSERKRGRRYRLVRRRSASCKAQGKPSCKIPTNEHKSGRQENQHFARNELHPWLLTGASEHESDRQENRHVARNDHSFDRCLSDTDDFHVHERTKKTAVKDMKQSERCGSPELDDVMLLEAPPAPVVHTKVESPQAIPRNRTPLFTMSFQENCPSSTSHMHPQATSGNETSLESSQGHCRSSTPQKYPGVNNVATSRDPAYLRRPIFQQRSNTSAESMPSPIRSTSNTNLTETSANYTVISNAYHTTLSSCQNIICKDSSPSSISSKSPCPILQPEILINSLTTKHIIKRKPSSACNEGKAQHNIQPGPNNDSPASCLASHIPSDDLLKHNVQQDDLSQKGPSENNQRGNLIPSNVRPSNSVSTRKPEIICRKEPFSEPDYSRSKSRRVLCDTNRRRLVSSPGGSSTTQPLTTQCERKSEVITSEKLKGQNHYSNSPSSNHQQSLQLKITPPRRAKFHPYATCNKSRTPPVISPLQSLTIRSPSLISPFRNLTINSPSSPRHKWTTLDRSPMAICVKQARRMSDPIVASRKTLEFGDFSSDNEKIKAQEERGSDQIKGESNPHYPRSKFRMQPNNKTDCRVEDDESRSNCSTGKCSKTFCFNCSMDLS